MAKLKYSDIVQFQGIGTKTEDFLAGSEGLTLFPITLTDANSLVQKWHRHHSPTQGGLFAIGCAFDERIVGAAIVGRPVARMLYDRFTAEVNRLVTDGQPHACSSLYGACWRAWKAMGGKRMLTYILQDEPGTSLKAAGWRKGGCTSGGNWSSEKRPRQAGEQDPKQRYLIGGPWPEFDTSPPIP